MENSLANRKDLNTYAAMYRIQNRGVWDMMSIILEGALDQEMDEVLVIEIGL